MLLHLVADYGRGDLAFAEVRQRLAALLPDAAVTEVAVPAFDTVSAGFVVAQLALTDGPPRVVYCNVAPRGDADDPRPDNEGERLVAARTGDDVWVIAPDAAHVFSFVAPEAVELRDVTVPAAGSQFRSRDVFPTAVAALARGDLEVLGEEVPADRRPPAPPERAVVYVDGYGNLKTSWIDPPSESGTQLQVRLGGVTETVSVSDGTFDVPTGTVSFAPGSSGWRDRTFYELFLRGGSAAERFGSPPAGTVVELL